MLFWCQLIFFQNRLFRKILSGIPSVCQTVWMQIRPDFLLGLIWVQTVCKGYHQMTLVGKDLTICMLCNFRELKKQPAILNLLSAYIKPSFLMRWIMCVLLLKAPICICSRQQILCHFHDLQHNKAWYFRRIFDSRYQALFVSVKCYGVCCKFAIIGLKHDPPSI